jgi:hypothetical protein
LGGFVGQIISQNIQQQCQYIPHAQGGGILFLIIGAILMIGSLSQSQVKGRRGADIKVKE